MTSCSNGATPGGNPPGETLVLNEGGADQAKLNELEDQAKALANTGGCASADQCGAAPVGNKACGGPRHYLPYCAATTDSAALFRKLDELYKAEDEFNTKYGMASDCMFVSQPQNMEVSGGACRIRPEP